MTPNWKQAAAAAIVTHEAPATADNSDLSLWHQLKAAIEGGKVADRSLDFAKSVMDGFVKYGSFTPKQADAVRNLIARSNGQAEPNPVEGPDKALATSLQAALPHLAPNDQNFATSLLRGFERYGSFTDRQRPYAQRLAQAAASLDVPPTAPKEPQMPRCPNICSKVNLNGLSRFAFGKLTLSLKNDGSTIWVKWNGRIAGSINPATAEYRQTRRYLSDYALAACLQALLTVEADPLAAARENGILTGRCSCCGRPLTDPASIKYGIGPVCRERDFGIFL
jgi:hypothetical protein